ncbi:uncharacterized protein LOC115874943 isoform X2 [Sitophilus oryzae]|uniref:Uncharacterized protein LOC115874943 isoform X2 n=1 Tax=Sitophilus oryzae TaxID=7048 RepID=A0A6J2X4L7_SITOR|nr:uncharacterized protein LOC115874943 isoform X2 [Sitophilus oryzae]
MDSAPNKVSLGPTVLLTIFVGLGVAVFVFFIKWIKRESPRVGSGKDGKPGKSKSSGELSGKHSKKEQTSSAKTASLKKKLTERENRRNNRASEKGFRHPWLLASLKGHTGRVLDMDFAANGKYLASCGDDPDPGDYSSLNDSSSSSSDSNPNSSPTSPSVSPVKGLSRRQRKNRRRDNQQSTKEENNKSSDSKKSGRLPSKKFSNQISSVGSQYEIESLKFSQLSFTPLEQYKLLSIDEDTFVTFLRTYALKHENKTKLGYPVRPAKKPQISSYQVSTYQTDYGHYYYHSDYTDYTANYYLDVHAAEFVPAYDSGDSGNGSEISGNCSEEDCSSSSSDTSEDLPDERYPHLVSGTTYYKGIKQRICVRCGKFFFTTACDYVSLEGCQYHWGKLRTLSYHGYGPLIYTCCGGTKDSTGCTSGNLHVWNGPKEITVNSSFTETEPVKYRPRRLHWGAYSLDCEMSYTVKGLEAVKITVVGISGNPVYNAFIKPKNKIVDFNTRFSGVSEVDFVKNNPKSLEEVQRDLKKFIFDETVVVGHGLENDFKALRLIHKTVVDTAFTFPHSRGLPYKRSLKGLTSDCLQRNIQCSESGHDSFEDARACMELMIYRVRRDYKLCH